MDAPVAGSTPASPGKGGAGITYDRHVIIGGYAGGDRVAAQDRPDDLIVLTPRL
jgi:hypothetical protein